MGWSVAITSPSSIRRAAMVPSRSLVRLFSIFMASYTKTTSPFFTVSPGFTLNSSTVPPIGAFITSPVPSTTTASGSALAAGAGAAATGATLSPAPANSISACPVPITSPSPMRMRFTTPALSHARSFSIFMASYTSTTSPFFTVSPTLTRSSSTVPPIGAANTSPVTGASAATGAADAAAGAAALFASYSALRLLVKKVFATVGRSSRRRNSSSLAASFTPPNLSNSGLAGVL